MKTPAVTVCWRIPADLAAWVRETSERDGRKIMATMERILREAQRRDMAAHAKAPHAKAPRPETPSPAPPPAKEKPPAQPPTFIHGPFWYSR